MKKIISVLLAIVIATAVMAVIPMAGQNDSAIIINGKDILTGDGDSTGISSYYLDDDGNIVDKAEATQLVLKKNGSFFVNGELVPAGENGKASITLSLPVIFGEAVEAAEEPFDEAADTTGSVSIEDLPQKEEVEGIKDVFNEVVEAPKNTANIFSFIWGRIVMYFNTILSFFGILPNSVNQ